jgi:fermentation-respiration switch protein FrsA (DUF1100 family)
MTALRRAVRLAGVAFALAACASCAVFGMRSTESAMLFPAPPAPAESPRLEADVANAFLATRDGRVEVFLLPGARGAGDAAGPLLVSAHGNGELVDFWLDAFGELRAQGISVLLVEYPGYGRSTGAPSEASIRRALVAGYDWALTRPDVDPGRVVGHGRSLGGGAVCALARERELAALVLESTFTSVGDVAWDALRVPGFLVWNDFDNLTCVRRFPGPVLVLHGESDEIIPAAHARRLADATPSAELALLPCRHNDCPRPWARVLEFLRAHALLESGLPRPTP